MLFLDVDMKKMARPHEVGTFIPVLFFILGVGVRKAEGPAIGLVATGCVFFALKILLKCRARPGADQHSKILDSLRLLTFVSWAALLSMFLGATYWGFRYPCAGQPPSAKVYKDKRFCIKADNVFIRDQKHQIFYGYGTIVNAFKIGKNIENKRIFFRVASATCEKIPLPGQNFTLQGNLRHISDFKNQWFGKYLKTMCVEWTMSDACMIACDQHEPKFQAFCRKMFDKFANTLRIGVESKPIEYGITLGMLTGSKQIMDEPSRAMFNDLGLSHLFAVSGIHIGIIAMVIEFCLKLMCVRKSYRVFPALLLLGCYVNVIGCSPSAVRALIMVLFYYVAVLLGRRPNVLAALVNSALCAVLYDPRVAFNISFLLSYSVVAGIVLLGIPLKQALANVFLSTKILRLKAYPPTYIFMFHIKKYFIMSFAISLAAYLASLPLSVDNFGVVSIMTVLVNIVVVPIASWSIILSALSLFFGLFKLQFVCFCLNKASCFFVGVFRVLAQCFYYEPMCLRGITLPVLGGGCATAIALCLAYLILNQQRIRADHGVF